MEKPSRENVEESDAIQRAIEYGVDISLLKENLRRTPAERIERLERVLEFMQEVRRAGQVKRGRDAERSQGNH